MENRAWTEGVSKNSIGRFGGFREDCVPYNNGYLHLSATATDLYLEENDERHNDLGHYQVPADCRLKTTASWTGMRYEFRLPNGRRHSTVTRSLLFPGSHHRLFAGAFEFYWRLRGFGAQHMVLPLKRGLVQRIPPDGYDLTRDGPMARPWVLFYFADSSMPFDYPMLLAFDKQPEKLEAWSHEYLKVYFAGARAGRPRPYGDAKATVVQVHPFGGERLDKAVTKQWKSKLPREVERKCDFWAAAAMAYPSGCREFYRIDERRGVVQVRNDYTYDRAESQWGVEPVELAPLPPVLASARHCGHPIKVKGKLLEKLCPTFTGHYEAVRGTSIEYELPLSRFRNHTLAPVRIEGDRAAEQVTSRLERYLVSGDYMTFGGDDHYDPNTSLDTLHDLRIMAWALWSIPEVKRARVTEHLTRGLRNFDFKEFGEYRTTTVGTPWVRHRTIFDYLGVIDYDMEWYNGMNLAGLWSWMYWVQDPAADRFLRDRWSLVRKLSAYNEAYCDWAHGVTWTCCRGEATWLDGINYTYEGLLGLAAMARRLGKRKDAERADYLAAKAEAFMVQCWKNEQYTARYFPRPGPIAPPVSGYYEGRGPNYGGNAGWSCGNYSYLVREIAVLLNDLGLGKEIARQLKEFAGSFPKWRSDPYSYGKASGYPGSDFRRTIHHYFLDPRLMVTALVAGEKLPKLMDVDVALTAPVLECYLVSRAPHVLTPRDARFGGSVWNARTKTLTVTLDGRGRHSVGIGRAGVPRGVMPRPVAAGQRDAHHYYTFDLSGPTDIVFQW